MCDDVTSFEFFYFIVGAIYLLQLERRTGNRRVTSIRLLMTVGFYPPWRQHGEHYFRNWIIYQITKEHIKYRVG